MKRIVIVRHAKAVPYGYHDDFNRDLRDRGKNDARLVSKELKEQGIHPDAMISSPAVRAMKTARIFAENLGFKKKKIQPLEDIYEGLTTDEFLEVVRALPPEKESVFFFGHNPGFYLFANYLLQTTPEEMPTCATTGIDFDVSRWEEVNAHTGRQSFRLIPKMFK